jgi:hypothetical protein
VTLAQMPFAADQWLVIEISEASLAMRGIGAKYPQAKIVFVGTDKQAVDFSATHRVRHGHRMMVCPFCFVDPDQGKINGQALQSNDGVTRLQMVDRLGDSKWT